MDGSFQLPEWYDNDSDGRDHDSARRPQRGARDVTGGAEPLPEPHSQQRHVHTDNRYAPPTRPRAGVTTRSPSVDDIFSQDERYAEGGGSSSYTRAYSHVNSGTQKGADISGRSRNDDYSGYAQAHHLGPGISSTDQGGRPAPSNMYSDRSRQIAAEYSDDSNAERYHLHKPASESRRRQHTAGLQPSPRDHSRGQPTEEMSASLRHQERRGSGRTNESSGHPHRTTDIFPSRNDSKPENFANREFLLQESEIISVLTDCTRSLEEYINKEGEFDPQVRPCVTRRYLQLNSGERSTGSSEDHVFA
jgi:hypothetical protein